MRDTEEVVEGGGGRDEDGEDGREREKVMQLFAAVQIAFSEDSERKESIRECVKHLEQDARGILITMETVHQCHSDDVQTLCKKIRELMSTVAEKYSDIQKLVPKNQYYRYHDYWRFVTQRLSFLVSLLVYLESGRLATRAEVAHLLGKAMLLLCGHYHIRKKLAWLVPILPACYASSQEEGFHLDLEDFLQGLLTMASELSRLAVNSVTQGDYQRPFTISLFLMELSAGFRLLNLKNDNLRKKFDALKYDVKKVEGVVYDITIRGLKPQ